MFQADIHAHIISVLAIVEVTLTLSVLHFLNDVSCGGGEIRALSSTASCIN